MELKCKFCDSKNTDFLLNKLSDTTDKVIGTIIYCRSCGKVSYYSKKSLLEEGLELRGTK